MIARRASKCADALRRRFVGEIILPGEAAYDGSRSVWNAMIDRRPAIVVRPRDQADVIAAVSAARDADLEIAVRGGGHSLPGLSTCDDGIVIDLSLMRGVRIDPDSRVARVQGGAVLGDLDEAAQAVRLVCPVGAVTNTGVAGLTLGGGMGRLQRKFGLTIDNLAAVELVTATGDVIRASDDEQPELFWGIRGAGPNFGIATQFEFRLHPFGPDVTAGMLVYQHERAPDILPSVLDFAVQAPDDVLVTIGNGRAPEQGDFAADLLGRRYLAIGVMHCGTEEDAVRDLAPLRNLGSPSMDTIKRTSYLEVQHEADPLSIPGSLRAYSKSRFLSAFSQAAIELYCSITSDAPTGCGLSAWTWGGAIGRTPDDATAFTGRDAAFWFGTYGFWTDAELDDANISWARAAMDAFAPFTTSAGYVNDQAETGADVVRAIYGDATYERLTALKRVWDPDNVFHQNQNIRP
jgi:FAD/FMN-containing dehydrogenase